MDSKSDKVLQQLNQREVERQLDNKLKRDAKSLCSAQNENIDFFKSTFKEKQAEITNLLNGVDNLQKDQLPEYLNEISKQITTLQAVVASNNIFLRTYDIKIYNEVILELQNRLKETENRLLPKKKFGFKNKKVETKVEKTTTVVDGKVDIKRAQLEEKYYGFKDETDKTLSLEDVLKKDVSLSNLKNCIIKIQGAPSTLHVSKLTNCKIFTGPVSTSIFVDDCIDSTFVICCQQLRLHSSTNVNVYLHVTSRAIMEDCSNINVAPYNWHYEGIDNDFALAGIDKNTNNWQSIDDFNWLNVESKSPNWNVMEVSLRNNWIDV